MKLVDIFWATAARAVYTQVIGPLAKGSAQSSPTESIKSGGSSDTLSMKLKQQSS